MMLISRDTDYAARALIYVARKGGMASVPELHEQLKIPLAFLRKIIQLLAKNGILASYKGKNGGFELAKKPEDIKLTDLMEIFQGEVVLNECIFKKKVCPNKKHCALRREIQGIEEDAVNRLKQINLKKLINK